MNSIVLVYLLKYKSLRWQPGLTAVELMVVISLLAIIASVAVPSFSGLLQRWRVRQSLEAMHSAIHLARSEAIKRSGQVALQRIPTSGHCQARARTNDWSCGWQVCVHGLGQQQCAPDALVIQRYEAPSGLQVQRSSLGEGIRFDRWGMPVAGFSFLLLPKGKGLEDAAAKGLCTSRGGRVRVVDKPPCPVRG
ncbi:GspH/FimT family pseudopilin [Comamonas sp. JUb58]|uniref:GspH/FimT family pseudopilin n=1 Tax=Comamonas sp. JUb58 TaxID=2485114 RepID=UPI001061AD48|nr:GspH/FimT family pseudopilin [Comamonas sp. JUb58]TDS84096.1 type IV fimbrial biogenesis protein FimT [Comamonas sp. JUb58]